jgi:hypothetical protein
MGGPKDSFFRIFEEYSTFLRKKEYKNSKKIKKISTLSSFTSTYAAPSPLFQLKPLCTRNLARCSPLARCGAGIALARV